MSWPVNAECPRCFRITDWYSRYAREENRCKCDGDASILELEAKRNPDGTWSVAA